MQPESKPLEDLIDYKPKALVPIWIKRTGVEALDKMAARPVLIDLQGLGTTMSGQLLDMTLTGARVIPNEPCLIWKNVGIGVRFRYSNVVYTLTGVSKESKSDNSVSFEFDDVSRQKMLLLAQEGLVKGQEAKKAEEKEAEQDVKKPHDPRKVRHLGGPGGLERRAHHRYDLSAEAVITNLDSGLGINCELLEISSTGCRIYTETPNTFEKDANVEVKFVGLGYPMRLSAVVQVKTGEHLLGLKFIELSYRIKTRLANLIFELAEMEP